LRLKTNIGRPKAGRSLKVVEGSYNFLMRIQEKYACGAMTFPLRRNDPMSFAISWTKSRSGKVPLGGD